MDSDFAALEEFNKSQASVTSIWKRFHRLIVLQNETIVFEADFINNLFTYLHELTYNPTGVTNLAQLVKFTRNFAQEDIEDRDIDVWTDALALGFNNTSPEFWKAYQADLYLGGPGGLLGAIERHNLDAVVLPTAVSSSFVSLDTQTCDHLLTIMRLLS